MIAYAAPAGPLAYVDAGHLAYPPIITSRDIYANELSGFEQVNCEATILFNTTGTRLVHRLIAVSLMLWSNVQPTVLP